MGNNYVGENKTNSFKGKRFRRLVDPEMQDKRNKCMCFRCNENFVSGHNCHSKQLRVLLLEDVINEEPDDQETKEDFVIEMKSLQL